MVVLASGVETKAEMIDWVSTCRSFEEAGPKSRDMHKKTWTNVSDKTYTGRRTGQRGGAYFEGTIQPVPAWKNGR